jgi:hypothetical protein
MVIEHIFSGIRLVLNKKRKGFIKTSEITTAVKMAVNDLYNFELDLYRKTGTISSKIKRFVKTDSVTITTGEGDLPTDFVKEVNFLTNSGKEGTFVTPEEFNDRTSSLILQPDEDDPIAKIQDNKIIVAPSDLPSVDLIYFRAPVDFLYDTTVDGDSRGESFDEAGSTDVEFDVVVSGDIIRRALLYLGVGFQNEGAAQVGSTEPFKQ